MLPGGKNFLITTNTEALVGNRSRQVRFVDGSTNKKIKRKRSRETAFFDQLRSGFLGEICDDTFLQTGTRGGPLLLQITGETVDDLRLVKQGAVQSGTAIRLLPKTW